MLKWELASCCFPVFSFPPGIETCANRSWIRWCWRCWHMQSVCLFICPPVEMSFHWLSLDSLLFLFVFFFFFRCSLLCLCARECLYMDACNRSSTIQHTDTHTQERERKRGMLNRRRTKGLLMSCEERVNLLGLQIFLVSKLQIPGQTPEKFSAKQV